MRYAMVFVALGVGAIGCKSDAPPVQVLVGGAESHRSFSPKTALAEYVEVPGARTELRLTLAEHDAACDRFVPPPDGQIQVNVLLVSPNGEALGPGEYAWRGLEGLKGPTQKAYAVPHARIGDESHQFQPGGSVKLSRVDLKGSGAIEGMLSFEYPGGAEHPASSLRGRFSASLCRLNRSE